MFYYFAEKSYVLECWSTGLPLASKFYLQDFILPLKMLIIAYFNSSSTHKKDIY